MKRSCIISKHCTMCALNSLCYRVHVGITHFCHLGNNALHSKTAIHFPKHLYIIFNYKYTSYFILSMALLRRNDYAHFFKGRKGGWLAGGPHLIISTADLTWHLRCPAISQRLDSGPVTNSGTRFNVLKEYDHCSFLLQFVFQYIE